MSTDKSRRARVGGSVRDQVDRGLNGPRQGSIIKAVSAEPEVLLKLVQDYHSSSFPNPSHIGCVPLEIVVEMVRSQGMVSDDWYRHLFTCSECFCEYRGAPTHIRALLKSEAGKFAMYEYLETIKFFTPSAELTMRVIFQNRKLAQLDRQAELGRWPPDEETAGRLFGREGREMSSAEHTERWHGFVSRFKDLMLREMQDNPEEAARMARRNQLEISNIMYGYLSVLSRQPRARNEGEPYDIWLYIPRGMGSRLGLMKVVDHADRDAFEARKYEVPEEMLFDDSSRELLLDLTREFSRWLGEENKGDYTAPWGRMRLRGERYLYLEATPRRENRKLRRYEGDAQYGSVRSEIERRVRK